MVAMPRKTMRSRRARSEAFYGDIDFIPTEEYGPADAARAYDDAAWVVALASRMIEQLGS